MKQNIMRSTRTGRKAEAAKGAGNEKKSGFPANYVHESKIKK